MGEMKSGEKCQENRLDRRVIRTPSSGKEEGPKAIRAIARKVGMPFPPGKMNVKQGK